MDYKKEYQRQMLLANDFRDRLKMSFGDEDWVDWTEKQNNDIINRIYGGK